MRTWKYDGALYKSMFYIKSHVARLYGLPSVVEDVDDGERGRLSMPDLADHLTERQRRSKHPAGDGHVLRHARLHQQPAALQHLWEAAFGLMPRLSFWDSHVTCSLITTFVAESLYKHYCSCMHLTIPIAS